MHFSKLPSTSGLLFMTILRITGLGDGFPIRHARFLHIETSLEFGFCLTNRNVDMLIPHTLQDRLVRTGFLGPGKGHVLLTKARKGRTDLGRIRLALGSHCDSVERVRVFWERKLDWMPFITQGITR